MDDSEVCSYGQLLIGSFITTRLPRIPSHAEFFVETSNHESDSALYSPDLAPCNFQLSPKLKSPLKRKRFQAVDEVQENMTGQLMAIGRTV